MQIAQEMAGYSLGGADLLRRAMGKKIASEMAKERPKFEKGAIENGVDKKKATQVFDLLAKFADYGFNKSHAAAYAVVSYQTAWLKANHPVEFMAGVMNCDIHLTDKLHVYFREVKRLDIEMIPPCVNRGEATFSVTDGKIAYALGGLKNVGVEAMKLITAARHEDGPFKDLFDFARRVDIKRMGKRPFEMLARAGAFDQLDANRHKVLLSVDGLAAYSAANFEQKNSSQNSLFGDSGEDLPVPRLPMPEVWLPTELLAQEHQAVGFYLSGHPLDDYVGPLKRQRPPVLTYGELVQKSAGMAAVVAKIAGTVSGVQSRKSARGNRYAYVQLSDPTGMYEVTVFSDVLESAGDLLSVGQNVVLSVEATVEGDQLKMLARGVIPIDSEVAGAAAKGLTVFVNDEAAMPSLASLLARDAKGARGPINLILLDPDLPGDVEISLPGNYPMSPQVKSALKAIAGVVTVEEF